MGEGPAIAAGTPAQIGEAGVVVVGEGEGARVAVHGADNSDAYRLVNSFYYRCVDFISVALSR
jgi:hypothetical protein